MDPTAVRSTSRVAHGGEPDRSLRDFSANVNPRVPDGVTEVYETALEAATRYPNDTYPDFRAAAGTYVDASPDSIVPTPGGLAAIRLVLATTLQADDTALVPSPSFSEYAREIRLQGATPQFIPHDELLETSDERLEACSLVVICTPNNPTGEVTPPEHLQQFVDRCGYTETIVLVDEAFLGFTAVPSAATLDHDHVVVARSLTKLFGLPGLRAGFAVAAGELRDRLVTARLAWSLGTPAARVGAHCLRDEEFVIDTRKRVAVERNRMSNRLSAYYDVYPSDAPFLLLDVGDRDVDTIVESARANGIALRDARTFRGLESHIRVAVKDRTANDHLLSVLTP